MSSNSVGLTDWFLQQKREYRLPKVHVFKRSALAHGHFGDEQRIQVNPTLWYRRIDPDGSKDFNDVSAIQMLIGHFSIL